jgi:hypothetical protein
MFEPRPITSTGSSYRRTTAAAADSSASDFGVTKMAAPPPTL